ncbi:class I SAM-dependent methyltransferase [Bradyrhizobium liaoningense]|uniref:class I SAM-dependent methyltransferase n=1 Tax=Bradyrhizobium liaoningense TaxID=43992 RepID=UPI001BAAD92E|nr:class I SAM-dependent methyltransferase [Bradyrhizobium liaoningense]MBR0713073.1 methyltransferase domain-containing protein [Bradyrhizobium liaoningense]
MTISDRIRSRLGLLVCTSCRNGGLAARDEHLLCTNCGTAFQVVRGVPRFVPDDSYAQSFGFQWNVHARTQLDSVCGKPISRNRLFETTKWPADLSGQTILEAGSGAGRFTEVLVTTTATVISCDLSSAVDANYRNNGDNANLLIVQASLLNLPVRPRSMDKVICLGVIQHTPDPAESFSALANCVRPGGELVIDVYAARLRSLLSWKYLLRPITKRMKGEKLYGLIERATPVLFPISEFLYRILGQFGLRLLPIVHYPKLNLSPGLSLRWAVLDTFDMYSPAHDHPQTLAEVKRWFDKAGFADVAVEYGPNGIVGRGRRPAGPV